MFSIPVIPGAADWINTVFANFDMNITLFIHQLYQLGGDLMTTIMEIISLFGKSGIFLILLSLAAAFISWVLTKSAAIAIGVFASGAAASAGDRSRPKT